MAVAAHRDVVVVRAALIVVALAIVDDAFVRPEAGTSIADHLAGGLLPAAAAIGLAWLYPRLRPGARAALALVCGSLAIAAGVTALLSLAAGVVLVGVGVTVLWRSRRRDVLRPSPP